MSSASSGRYQSRLFNFIHQQSRRVTEQCQRALKHIQVATGWVAPVVLYPLYLLFQPNREPGRQMHQAVEDAKSQFPTVDAPIQRVLLLVNALPLEEANKKSRGNHKAGTDKATLSPVLGFIRRGSLPAPLVPFAPCPPAPPCSLTHNRPLIRGIATQLLSRTLVLVTARNEILDILTPQQQQKLQERIVREVGEYWRYQRLTHQREGRLLLPTPYSLLPLLDRTFAELESNHLAPLTVVMTLGKRSWTIFQQVKTQFKQHYSDTSIATVNAENRTFRIQALIWAAIDYFFGNRNEKLTLATTSTPKPWRLLASSKPPRKPLDRHRVATEFSPQVLPHIVSSDTDPWLTFSDLFGDLEPEGKSLQQIPGSSNQKTSQVARRINLTLPSSKLSIPALTRIWRTAKTAATTTHPLANVSPLQPKSDEEICSQFCSQDTQHEPTAAWIETYATAIGYVKHPLEQLLEWLDRIMLWLEEVLMMVWRWMRSSKIGL